MFKEFKPAIVFLVKFFAIYLTGTVAYGIYIRASQPYPDAITQWVTHQMVYILEMKYGTIQQTIITGTTDQLMDTDAQWKGVGAAIALATEKGISMVSVFEGCNGFVIVVLFLAFLIAFGGPGRKLAWFIPLGIIAIHVANLFRLVLLGAISIDFPQYLFFTHKYLFTAIIYGAVFLLWYVWVIQVGKSKGSKEALPLKV